MVGLLLLLMKSIVTAVLLFVVCVAALGQSQPAVFESKEFGVTFKIPEGWMVGDDAAKQAYAQAVQIQPNQRLLLLLTRTVGDAPTERITVAAYVFEKGLHPTLEAAERFINTWADSHSNYERAEQKKQQEPSQQTSPPVDPKSASAGAWFKSKNGQERWIQIYATQAKGTFFRVIGEFNSEAALREAKMRLKMVPDWVNPDEKLSDDTEVQPSPVHVQQAVTQGLLIKKVAPQYPEIARRKGVQGTVVLQGVISKRGKIAQLVVIFGEPTLVTAAMQAVKQWEYRPYLMNGEPVEVDTEITVNYSLQR